MTWAEFKVEAARQGLKDSDTITMIDWKDYDDQLFVKTVVTDFKSIIRPEHTHSYIGRAERDSITGREYEVYECDCGKKFTIGAATPLL